MKDFRSKEAIDAAIKRNRRDADMHSVRPGFMEGYPAKFERAATAAAALVAEVSPVADLVAQEPNE